MSIQQNYPAIKSSLNLDFANTKQLDPRITYSRASTGTYYDGKAVAKAEENLLVYSQDFDNAAWTKSAASVTANTEVAPDGTTTADTLTSDGASTQHNVSAAPTLAANSTYAFSVYAKAGATNFLQITTNLTAGSANHYANFNLQTGVVSAVGSSAMATITAVGNGWYRCTAVMTTVLTSASATFILIPVDSGTATRNPTFATATSVQLWSAQLEQRASATAYTPTTTAPITNYIPVLQTASAGTPRFDHNPITGESLGLLIEEQRTNLMTYSEQFDNAAWSKARASISANATAAPDGTTTADKLVEDTSASNTHQAFRSTSVSAGTPHTFSVYIKADGRNFAGVRYENTGSTEFYQVNVNLTNGTATTSSFGSPTGTSFSVTSAGNAWWRVSITVTTSNTGFQSVVYLQSVQGSNNYTSDGFSGIYIWGAQLEAGAFATSYIPTVASQVTRAADSASMIGNNFARWYNQTEGTLFAEAAKSTTAATTQFLFDMRDTSTTRISLQSFGAASSFVVFNGTLQAALDGASTVAVGENFKVAGAYQTNDFAMSLKATAVQTDGAGTVPVVLSANIGSISGSSSLNGTIKRIAYYPRRLTNTQLQALTS